MQNYKICVEYDGSEFFGWQSQPSGNTIQDHITRAIYQITHEKVNLIGSGRTDSGVHALGQVANFKLKSEIYEYRFINSLNSILPSSIAIKNIDPVNDSFHSRFDAKRRSYIYLFSTEKSAFFDKYSFTYPIIKTINIDHLKSLSKNLLGEHDFTSLCRANTDTVNKKCNVYEISWKRTKGMLICKIEANRFLHGMVRTLVGTLLGLSKNEEDSKSIIQILESRDRKTAGEAFPAKGLYLYKVKY